MITENYIKAMVEGKAGDLLEAQRAIASTTYKGGTGRLMASLNVTPKMQGMKLNINYPLYIRFLDLSKKKTKNGYKRKKGYTSKTHEIYNRYTFRHLYCGIPGNLVEKLGTGVKQTLDNMFSLDG